MKTLATVAVLLCSFFQMGVAIVLEPGQFNEVWGTGATTYMIHCWSESTETGLTVWRVGSGTDVPMVAMSGNVCNPQELVALIGTPGNEDIRFENTGENTITAKYDYYPVAAVVNTARAEPGDCVGLVIPVNYTVGVNPTSTNSVLHWSVRTDTMSGDVTTLITDTAYHAGVAFSPKTADTLWVCANDYAIQFEYSLTEGPLLAAEAEPDVKMETS